jgi:hypothetical protein
MANLLKAQAIGRLTCDPKTVLHMLPCATECIPNR